MPITVPESPTAIAPEERDFSVVVGGPLFQALRRARLAGDGLQLVRRRIATVVVLAWVPLLALARNRRLNQIERLLVTGLPLVPSLFTKRPSLPSVTGML